MKFCDETTVTFKAGNGGGGAVSFRREKFVAYGGPDGGNGGNGGNIILKADANINTLVEFNTYKFFKAPSGEPGSKQRKNGAEGEDLVLKVPVGTLIWDEEKEEQIADLKQDGEEFIAARGGRGGKGNAHFISSTRQAPAFAELGEPGVERILHLELKLVADVGIIGLPSAGKSTLISHISAVKPKIADYPFTTLIPNLGVVDMKRFGSKGSESFMVIDVPGLIEGAAEGKGLGHEFLRHIGRAAFLIHLLDGSLDELRENYETINNELQKYSDEIAKKEQVIVINKADILIPEIYPEIQEQFAEFHKEGRLFFISAVTGEGLKELMFYVFKRVQDARKHRIEEEIENHEETEDHKVFRPHLIESPERFTIEFVKEKDVTTQRKENKRRHTKRDRIRKKDLKDMVRSGEISEEEFEKEMYIMDYGFSPNEKTKSFTQRTFNVSGKRINQIVIMTDTNNSEAVDRVHDVMSKMGIQNQLVKEGAKPGDIVIIAEKEFIFRGE